jgi:MoaA/NifB/PqqE/SkfB family radical SAM enzyme
MLKKTYLRTRRKLAHLRGDQRAVVRWSNLIATHDIVPLLRARFDPGIPPGVNLEINTDCNYKCPFCPQSSVQRPIRYITRQGFDRVVQELKALDYAGLVVLSVNNEPFLHPLLLDFCGQVSDELPNAQACLISNGALIREEQIMGLARLARPPRITVDDYTPDRRVIERLSQWLSRPEARHMPVQLLERSWDETISNRAGNQPGCTTVPADYREVTCAWPFGGLFLTPELKAFLCCSDYRHEMIVGDLNRQSLMEIWSGPALRRVREALLVPDRSAVGLCSRCDAEWWRIPEHCKRES